MSIAFVIPSMRPNIVKRVLHDLDNQTLVPSRVLLVDNSTQFVSSSNHYRFDFEVMRPGKNIGTNAAWNLALRFEEEYCGILGDDYRLEPMLVEKLLYGLVLTNAGATVPEIVQKRRGLVKGNNLDISCVRGLSLGTGKGKCSAVLMPKEVAHNIPLIPDHFKIFFGDNWIGHHIIKQGFSFMQLFPCYVYHKPGKNNVSASLNYKGVLKHERKFWNKFLAEAE